MRRSAVPMRTRARSFAILENRQEAAARSPGKAGGGGHNEDETGYSQLARSADPRCKCVISWRACPLYHRLRSDVEYRRPLLSRMIHHRHCGAVPLFALVLMVLPPASDAALAQLRGHGGPVRALAISPDGETAVSASFDSTAIRWSLARNAAEQVLRFHADAVNAVVF